MARGILELPDGRVGIWEPDTEGADTLGAAGSPEASFERRSFGVTRSWDDRQTDLDSLMKEVSERRSMVPVLERLAGGPEAYERERSELKKAAWRFGAPIALGAAATAATGGVAIPALAFGLGGFWGSLEAQEIERQEGLREDLSLKAAVGEGVAASIPGLPSAWMVGRPLLRATEGVAQAILGETAYRTISEGRLPSWEELGFASAFGGVFGTGVATIERRIANKAAQAVRNRRESLASRVVGTHNQKGGSTFDLSGGNLAGTDNFAVSLFPERSVVLDRPMTRDDVLHFIQSNEDIFRDPRIAVGTRYDQNSGKTYIDAVVVLPDEQQALSLGKQYNQKSIFNLGTFDEIPTGGTGDPIPNLPPASERLKDLPTLRAKWRRWIDQQADAAENRLTELGKSLHSGVPLDKSPDVALIAARTILNGADTFDEFANRMMDRFGDRISPHLDKIRRRATRMISKRMELTSGELTNTKKLLELFRQGESTSEWYAPTMRELNEIFGPDTDLFVRFLAATSPTLGVEANITAALKAYVQHKTGSPFKGYLFVPTKEAASRVTGAKLAAAKARGEQIGTRTVRTKQGKKVEMPDVPRNTRDEFAPEDLAMDVRSNLERAVQGEVFGGPKVQNFLAALRGDPDAMVIDRWMMRALGFKNKDAPAEPAEYEFLSNILKDAAAEAGVKPAFFQENVWRGIKRTQGQKSATGELRFTEASFVEALKRRLESGTLLSKTVQATLGQAERRLVQELQDQARASGTLFANPFNVAAKYGTKLVMLGTIKVLQGFTKLADFAMEMTRTTGLALGRKWTQYFHEGRQKALNIGSLFERNREQYRTPGEVPASALAPKEPLSPPARAATEAATATDSAPFISPSGREEQRWRRLEGAPVPPQSKMPADRISREMFERVMGPERADSMYDLAQTYADAIDRQSRGTQHAARTEALADQYHFHLEKALPPGSTLNKEETRGLIDTVAGLQGEVEDLSAQLNRTDLDDAARVRLRDELSEKYAAYVNGVMSMMGTRAEWGRAGQAWQIMARARQGNDPMFVAKAKMLGIEPEKIAEMLAKTQSPLERYKMLRDYHRIRPLDVFKWYWFSNMLSGPVTHENNFVSNSMSAILMIPRTLAATPADIVRSKLTGSQREVFLGEIKPQMVGGFMGIRRGWARGMEMLRNGFTLDDAADLRFRPNITAADLYTMASRGQQLPPDSRWVRGPWATSMNLTLNAPSRLLGFVDQFFRGMNHEMERYSAAYVAARRAAIKDKFNGPGLRDETARRMTSLLHENPKWLMDRSATAGSRGVYEEPLGSFGKWLLAGRATFPVAGTLVTPFVSIPINLAKRGLQMSPAGLAMAMKESDPRRATQKWGEAIIGTLAALPLAMWASEGRLTGRGPSDPAERDRLRQQGWQPESILIGNRWYSYQNTPFALPAAMLANFFEARKEMMEDPSYRESMQDEMTNMAIVLGRSARSWLNQSFLSGIMDWVQAMEDPDNFLPRVLQRYATTAIPASSLMRTLVQTGVPGIAAPDRVLRRPFNLPEAMKANIPGLSHQLQPYLRATGEEVTRKSHPLDPFRSTPVEPDVLREELARVGVEQRPPFQTDITIGGQRYRINDPNDVTEFNKAKGRAARILLETVVGTDRWGQLTDAQKEKVARSLISRASSYVRAQAIRAARAGQPWSADSLVQELEARYRR